MDQYILVYSYAEVQDILWKYYFKKVNFRKAQDTIF